MNKKIISIIVGVILVAGIIGSAWWCMQKLKESNIPHYFIAIHNEPYNLTGGETQIERDYIMLKQMIEKANEYNIKLTLMFTPQWADYITESPERMAELESWEKQGHEIAAHHHSIYHTNWDGYTDYSEDEAEAQRIRQSKIPEGYFGTLEDYINKLEKINPNIHSGCVNDEIDKKVMPDEIIYDTCSGFANHGDVGTKMGDAFGPEKGINEYITVGTYKNIQRKWLAHFQINTNERQESAQAAFSSMDSGVYGSVVHSFQREMESYCAFLEFLHSKDPSGKNSRTVSEIITQRLLPIKMIPEELINKTTIPLSSTAGKCGDGICDENEKADPNLCPKDCKLTNQKYDESPFGFHPGNANNYAYIQDMNAVWSREGTYIIWDWVDVNRNGNFKFSDAAAPPKDGVPGSGGRVNYDALRQNTPESINIVTNVCPFRKDEEFADSQEKDLYFDFVIKIVERYDGDSDLGCTLTAPDCYNLGDNDYPSKEIIEKFETNPIKYWQVCNQVTDACDGKDCRETYAEKYAEVQKITYQAVKEADSSAYVLIAGDSHKELYPDVFQHLDGSYIDIIDFHRFGTEDDYNPKDDFDYLKASLQSSGFDLNELIFWITETGTYSGDPVERVEGRRGLPYQSEQQQASGLFKRYVSALSYEIEKVFWAWNIVEGFKRDCSIFDYTGLIYDGCDCNEDGQYVCEKGIGYDLGQGTKKLSYYTYKFMVDKLEGSDWNNIQTIQESDNIYIYKFIKKDTGEQVWVAWQDYFDDTASSKTIALDVGSISTVKISEAVPNAESGADLNENNYPDFFETEIQTVSNGKSTITLDESPVFVEEN